MAQQSVLANVIVFLDRIGIYDVVLPFLLVFTIVFAILERSKVLGTEKMGDDTVSKKNLNAMAAFVIAFLVIASSKLVATITQISSQMVILILLSIFFLLLAGMFYKEGEVGKEGLKGGWKKLFLGINFVGLVVIFMNAIRTENGNTWLEELITWLNKFWTSAAVASIILIIIFILMIRWIIGKPEEGSGSGSGSESGGG